MKGAAPPPIPPDLRAKPASESSFSDMPNTRDPKPTPRPYRAALAASVGSALFSAFGVAALDVVLTASGAKDAPRGDVVRFATLATSLYLAAGLVAGLVEGIVAGAIRATYPEGATVALWRRLAADRALDRRVTGAILATCGSAALYAGTVAVLALRLVGATERKLVGAILCGLAAAALLPLFGLATYPFYRVTRWIARAVPRLGPVPATVVMLLFTLGAGTTLGALFVMTKLDWRALPLGGPLAGALFFVAQLAFVVALYGPLSGVRKRLPGRTVALGVAVALALVAPTVTLLGGNPPERALALLTSESMGAKTIAGVVRVLADRDRDGYAALLGGGDCDDRRPDVHPGAEDVPGNGIDENCLGGDARPRGAADARGGGAGAAGGGVISPGGAAGGGVVSPGGTATIGSSTAGGGTALSGAAAPPAGAAAPSTTGSKPAFASNVLVIAVDTLRADRLGVAGYTRRGGKSLTPRMDELARRGVWFSRAYAQATNTPRSFPSIVTSRYPSQVVVDQSFKNYPVVMPDNVTMWEALRDAGYKTIGFSSHFYFTEERGITQGFVEYDNEGAKSIRDSNADVAAPRIVPKVERRLAELGGSGEKFAMFVHLFEPHSTYVTHPEFPIQSTGVEGLEEKYDYEIAFVDAWVGKIVDAVAAAGLADKTMIVLLSDHGEAFGVHRFGGQKMFFHGQTLYDELLRVPLIVHVPGMKPARVDQPVMLIDVAPTILDVLGAPIPATFVGRSLAPALAGEALAPRPVFAELLPYPNWDHAAKAIIDETGRAKLIYRISENLFELYDLAEDPEERKDVVHMRKDVAEKLKQQLIDWMESEL